MVRYWDLAGTEVTKVKGEKRAKDPDWTVGCLLHLQEEGPAKGRLTVCDVVRMRGNPGEVLDCVKATAVRDGKEVPIWIGQDPGQAGKFEIVAYESELRGWQVWGYKETGDKITRAGPVSAHALHGQVDIVSAPWNGAFFSVLEEFPEGPHDDDMDALSGGYAVLTESPPPSYGEMPAKDISRPWSRLGYQAPRR